MHDYGEFHIDAGVGDAFRSVRRAFEALQLQRLLADVSPTLVELDQVLRAKRGCRRG